MAPASPITTRATLLRPSVVVSPSDGVRAGSVGGRHEIALTSFHPTICGRTPAPKEADGSVFAARYRTASFEQRLSVNSALFEHHFGGLDHGRDFVAHFEFHFLGAALGDHALD